MCCSFTRSFVFDRCPALSCISRVGVSSRASHKGGCCSSEPFQKDAGGRDAGLDRISAARSRGSLYCAVFGFHPTVATGSFLALQQVKVWDLPRAGPFCLCSLRYFPFPFLILLSFLCLGERAGSSIYAVLRVHPHCHSLQLPHAVLQRRGGAKLSPGTRCAYGECPLSSWLSLTCSFPRPADGPCTPTHRGQLRKHRHRSRRVGFVLGVSWFALLHIASVPNRVRYIRGV